MAWCVRNGLGWQTSATGLPNSFIGRTNFSPSSTSPAQQGMTITTGLPCSSSGTNGSGGAFRCAGDPVAVKAQHLRRVLHRPEDRPGEHGWAQRNEIELELGHDPEVAAAAANAPEEILVLVRGRLDELAVGGDQIHAPQLVDREAVPAHDPADSAPEGQPGDARVRDDP